MNSSYLSKAVARNAALMLADTLFSRGSLALLCYFMAVRYGPEQFGIIMLGFAILAIAGALSQFGASVYGIRAVASGEGSEPGFLSSVLTFQFLNAVVIYGLTAAAALAFFGADAEGLFILLLGASVIPDRMMNAVRVAFLGRENFLPSVLLNIAMSLAVLAAGVVALKAGATLLPMGGLLLLLSCAGCVAAFLLYRRYYGPLSLRLEAGVYRRMAARSFPYFLMHVLTAVHTKAGMLIIRALLGAAEVGLYGLASTVIGFACTIMQSMLDGLFPAVARMGGAGGRLDHARALRTLAVPLGAGLVLAVGLSAGAGPLIRLLLGTAYEGSVLPLVILSWSLPAFFVSSVSLRMLAACAQTSVVHRVLAVNCGVSILANLALVPVLGISGTAVATVLSALVSAVQSVAVFVRGLSVPADAEKLAAELDVAEGEL